MPGENLKKLYDNLYGKYSQQGFNVPYEQFATDMQDESKLMKLHDNLTNPQSPYKWEGFNVPYEQFAADMGFGAQEASKFDEKGNPVTTVKQIDKDTFEHRTPIRETKVTDVGKGIEAGGRIEIGQTENFIGRNISNFGDFIADATTNDDLLKLNEELKGISFHGNDVGAYKAQLENIAKQKLDIEKAKADYQDQLSQIDAKEKSSHIISRSRRDIENQQAQLKSYDAELNNLANKEKTYYKVLDHVKSGGDVNELLKQAKQEQAKFDDNPLRKEIGDPLAKYGKEVVDNTEILDNWAFKVGMMTAQALPTLAAVASAPFTGGTSLAVIPSIIGTANMALLTTSSMGGALMEMDNYEKEKGIKIDPITRTLIAGAYGTAEFVPEYMRYESIMKPISGFLGKYVTKLFLEEMPGLGKHLLEGYAKMNPTGAKALVNFAMKSSGHAFGEGTEEGITQITQDFVSNIYKDDEDKLGFKKMMGNVVEAAAAGALTGKFIGVSQVAATNKMRNMNRENRGYVTLAENKEDGTAVEILGKDDKGNYNVLRPNGKQETMTQEQVGETLTMKTDDFNSYMEAYNSNREEAKEVEKSIYKQTTRQNIDNYINGKVNDASGEIITTVDDEGQKWYVVHGDPDNPNPSDLPIVVNENGDKKTLDFKPSEVSREKPEELLPQLYNLYDQDIENLFAEKEVNNTVAERYEYVKTYEGKDINVDGKDYQVTNVYTDKAVLDEKNEEGEFGKSIEIPIDKLFDYVQNKVDYAPVAEETAGEETNVETGQETGAEATVQPEVAPRDFQQPPSIKILSYTGKDNNELPIEFDTDENNILTSKQSFRKQTEATEVYNGLVEEYPNRVFELVNKAEQSQDPDAKNEYVIQSRPKNAPQVQAMPLETQQEQAQPEINEPAKEQIAAVPVETDEEFIKNNNLRIEPMNDKGRVVVFSNDRAVGVGENQQEAIKVAREEINKLKQQEETINAEEIGGTTQETGQQVAPERGIEGQVRLRDVAQNRVETNPTEETQQKIIPEKPNPDHPDYVNWVSEFSDDADEIARTYEDEQGNIPDKRLQDWQRELLGAKVMPESFYRYGDRNKVTGKMARGWFKSRNNGGKPIDRLAQDLSVSNGIEVTPQDIIEFMIDNPGNYVRKTTNETKNLSKRYKEITGISIKNHKFANSSPGNETSKQVDDFILSNDKYAFSYDDYLDVLNKNKGKLSDDDYNNFLNFIQNEQRRLGETDLAAETEPNGEDVGYQHAQEKAGTIEATDEQTRPGETDLSNLSNYSRERINDIDSKLTELDASLNKLKQNKQKKVNALNMRNGLFGDTGPRPSIDFDQETFRFNKENIDKAVKPIDEDIRFVEDNITSLKKQRDDVIKSDKDQGNIRFRKTEVYQNSQRAIEKIPFEKGTLEQFKANLLKNGAKEDELSWMEWDEFVKGKDKLTKAEVKEWIEQNKVELNEVIYHKDGEETGNKSDNLTEEAKIRYDELIKAKKRFEYFEEMQYRGEKLTEYEQKELEGLEEEFKSYDNIVDYVMPEFENNLDNFKDETVNKTKYLDYTTKGSKNYKEVLFVMPEKSKNIIEKISDNEYKIIRPNGQYYTIEGSYEKAKAASLNDSKTFNKPYKSSHFDEPNIVAHARISDFVDNEGKNVLMVEEIQSDWAEEGRQKGFKNNEFKWDTELGKKAVKAIESENNLGFNTWQEAATAILKDPDFYNTWAVSYDNMRTLVEWKDAVLEEKKPPNMPFKKTDQWVGLVMKKIINYAVENGYDKVAFTTGEQQADRYDLSKQVETISYSLDEKKIWIYPKGKNPIVKKFDDENELSGIVGKDMAKRIFAGEGTKTDNKGIKEFNGIDLKIGGEGMKAFYDNIVVNWVNRFGKKYGVKVVDGKIDVKPNVDAEHGINQETGEVDMEQVNGKYLTVHSFDITPELQDAAANGLPMFKKITIENKPESPVEYLEEKEGFDERLRELREVADQMAYKLNTPIIILNKESELPKNLQNTIKRQGANDIVTGLYDNNSDKVYVILKNNRDAEEVKRTILHETVAHKGLKDLLGDGYRDIMLDVYKSIPKQRLDELQELYGSNDPFELADEYMAQLSEEDKKLNFVQRAIAKIRQLLRRLFGIKYNDNDIHYLLGLSRKNLQSENKYGKGLTVKHGTSHTFEKFDLSKIGSGQGEKIHGYGLYFTEVDQEADYYANVSSRNNNAYYDKVEKDLGQSARIKLENALIKSKYNREEAMELIDKKINDAKLDDAYKKKFIELKEYINKHPLPKDRRIATAIIHKDKFSNEINWMRFDLPLSLKNRDLILSEMNKRLMNKNKIYNTLKGEKQVTGEDVYKGLSEVFGSDEKASKFLSTIGIDGIKYEMDADVTKSKKGGYQGKFSYVMFDDSKIEIVDNVRFKLLKKEKNPNQMLRNRWDRFRQAHIDKMISVKKLQELVEKKGGKVTDGSNPHVQENLSHSRASNRMEDIDKNYRQPILRTVNDIINKAGSNLKEGQQEINDYLIAKHTPERNKYYRDKKMQEWMLKHPTATQELIEAKRESLSKQKFAGELTDEKASKIINEFEGKIGKELTGKLLSDIKKMTERTLELNKEYGFIDMETYENLKKMYSYYVPLRGFADKYDDLMDYHKTSYHEILNPLKKAEGRTSKADEPLPFITNMAYSVIVTGEKNLVKQSAARLVSNNREILAEHANFKKYYEVITGVDEEGNDIVGVFDDPNKIPEEFKDENGKFIKGSVKVREYTTHKKYKAPEKAKSQEVSLFKDGKKYTLVFTDPEVAAALNNDYQVKIGNVDLKPLEQFTSKTVGRAIRWLSMLSTGKNPAFVIPNTLRDFSFGTKSAYIDFGVAGGLKFANNYRKAFGAVLRNEIYKKEDNSEIGKMYRDFKENGGETGYIHLRGIESIKNEIDKELSLIAHRQTKLRLINPREGIRALDKIVTHMSIVSENSARFAAYMTAKEMGYSDKEAASYAKKSTVNFNQKGRVSSLMGNLYAFWNARIQGIDRYYGLFRSHPRRAITFAVVDMAKGYLFRQLLSWWWGADDDETKELYKNMPQYFKDNYTIIPLLGKNFITIPNAHGFGQWHSIGMMTHDLINGNIKPGEYALKVADIILQSSLPADLSGGYTNDGKLSIRPLIPTWAMPFYDISKNETFSGYPIYKESFTLLGEHYNAESQMGLKNASKLIKVMTDLLFELGGGDNKVNNKYYYDKEGSKLGKVPDLLDWNPSKIEYYLKYIFSGSGKFYMDMIKSMFEPMVSSGLKSMQGKQFKEELKESYKDIDKYDIPIINRFWREVPEENIAEQYYTIKNEVGVVDNLVNQYKANQLFGDFIDIKTDMYITKRDEMFKGIASQVDNYDEMIKKTENLQDKENYEKQRKISMKQAVEIYKQKEP